MATSARPVRSVKLLLDEMHASSAAEALRAAGFDVVAVTAITDWRGRSDEEVLEAAANDDRAVVTENVRDFAALARQCQRSGRAHAGIVFTSPVRFNRATKAYPGSLISALRGFLEQHPIDGDSWTWWL